MAGKYLTDKDGKILKDASGNPMPLENFENESSGKYYEATADEPDYAPIRRHLDAGHKMPDYNLFRIGWKKVNGKWFHPEEPGSGFTKVNGKWYHPDEDKDSREYDGEIVA